MRMLIEGDWCEAEPKAVMDVRNPASGESVAQVPRAGEGDALRAVRGAVAARALMKQMPVHRRSEILERTASLILAREEELAQLLVSENGKTILQCRSEIETTARLFKGFAEEAKRIFGQVIPLDTVPGLEKNVAITIRQPLGIVVGIVPFNYPVELWAHKVAPVVAAGNAGIFILPAECPLAILRIAELLVEAGLPPEAMQYLTGNGGEFGDVLVAHPEVALISFTGSVATARHINALAARYLKRVHLELGGVDPIIVCSDADLVAAAEAVVASRLTNGAGQICCASKRIIVDPGVFDPFVDLLLQAVSRVRLGDPRAEQTDIGPLIHRRALEKVQSQVEASARQGARIAAGGSPSSGNFYPPTVLLDVTEGMSIMDEEVFGPVAPIYRARDLDDAVRVANNTRYGLQAGVFTRDLNRAFQLSMALEVGGVVVNGGPAFRPGNVPFGGWKESGQGRESLLDTVRDMTELKTITFNQVLE